MTILHHHPDAGKPQQHLSSQTARRSARAFIADAFRGEVPGVPPGSTFEPSEVEGAELVTPDGHRRPVGSHWVRARLMFWMDPQPIPCEHALRLSGSQITPADVDVVLAWIAAEVHLSAESSAWHCESLDTTGGD